MSPTVYHETVGAPILPHASTFKVASRVLIPERYMLEVVSDQSRNRACSVLRLDGAVIAVQKSSRGEFQTKKWSRSLLAKSGGACEIWSCSLSFQAHVTFPGLRLVTWGFGCLIAFDAYGNYTCKSLCTGREMRPARPFCFVMFILSNNQGGASYCY